MFVLPIQNIYFSTVASVFFLFLTQTQHTHILFMQHFVGSRHSFQYVVSTVLPDINFIWNLWVDFLFVIAKWRYFIHILIKASSTKNLKGSLILSRKNFFWWFNQEKGKANNIHIFLTHFFNCGNQFEQKNEGRKFSPESHSPRWWRWRKENS